MASNYIDKPVDLVAWHGPTYVGWSTLSQCLFSDEVKSEVCTGIQKLVQRWLAIFLTPIGSITFDKSRGTSFMMDIYTCNTEKDIFMTFQLNNSLALDQLAQEERESDTPENEKVKSITLTGISLILGSASLSVKVISQTDEETNIVLPIDTNPLQL